MQKFTIELDDTICTWLAHMAEIIGKPIEIVIADGVYNQVNALEDNAIEMFTYCYEPNE